VNKDAKTTGGDLEIYGMVIGNVVNEGGRVYVDKEAHVKGKVVGTVSPTPLPPPEPAKPTAPATPPGPSAPPPG